MYSKLSSEITSITGHTTAFRLAAISASSGSSHPSVHSQCASKKVITAPFAALAPNNLQGGIMLNNKEFTGKKCPDKFV